MVSSKNFPYFSVFFFEIEFNYYIIGGLYYIFAQLFVMTSTCIRNKKVSLKMILILQLKLIPTSLENFDLL